MDKPTTLFMVNILEQPVSVNISSLIFVIPILAGPEQLQVYDDKGQVYVCLRDYFEKKIKEDHSHRLENVESIWVDHSYWNADVLESDSLRSLNALGGVSDIPMAELLMIVKRGAVYTLFTEQGLFLMPALVPIRTFCPAHEYNYSDKRAWRKGKTPKGIQDYVLEKGMRATLAKPNT